MNYSFHSRWMAVILIVILAACSRPEESVDNSEILDFATQYAAAWSSQDAALLASHFSENGALQINDGEPSVGREAIAAVAQSFMTDLPDMIVRLDSLRVVDEIPQFHWTLIATNSGPDGSGNRIQISGYEEWTFDEDGLIQQSLGHMDSEEYQRQLEYGAPEN